MAPTTNPWPPEWHFGGPFGTPLGTRCPSIFSLNFLLGPEGAPGGPVLDFVSILIQFGVHFGTIWAPFGAILVPFWVLPVAYIIKKENDMF